MAKKINRQLVELNNSLSLPSIDCACVIHGSGYDWVYVDTLYSMLSRNLTPQVNLHVYTEATRPVPPRYIKHELVDWKIAGPKKSWWYKIQMFNTEHHAGPMLYFDLDTVILRNIDWMWQQSLTKFWTVKDFKHLYRPSFTGMNSSIMWWDTRAYSWIWDDFHKEPLANTIRRFPGDQDYLTNRLGPDAIRFFDTKSVKSWRWECFDGGYDFNRRRWHNPGVGTHVDAHTSVLVFHGKPKPHETNDPVIKQLWQ